MQIKTKIYSSTKFSPAIIRSAYMEILKYHTNSGRFAELHVALDDGDWDFDNLDEFYASIPFTKDYGLYDILDSEGRFIIRFRGSETRVSIGASNRGIVQTVFQIFEDNLEKSKLEAEKRPVKIFIGHGHDNQWKELKDHLHDKQGYEVSAYETAPRTGMAIKEVLEIMQSESSFAILVMTGEDTQKDGSLHARENVIHEIGLFQGRLGFSKAIVLKENGVEEFSNISGLNQIRFSKGVISGTFGDILATLKREFKD